MPPKKQVRVTCSCGGSSFEWLISPLNPPQINSNESIDLLMRCKTCGKEFYAGYSYDGKPVKPA